MHTAMTTPINEKGRASRAPAGTTRQGVDYSDLHALSSRKLLEEAADVLCLLAFFPLTKTARTVLVSLLERRIDRAYAGGAAMNGQALLFDASAEPKRLEADIPLSHRSDPQTSYEAAENLKRSGKLGAQQQAVLEALRACDGATHAELGAFMGLHWLTPAGRLPELGRAGLVRKGEARICRIKGSRCTTWWIVEGESK
jgi:DNA-binding transcriptional ArsR family regulator